MRKTLKPVKVEAAQYISRMCIVCGEDNPLSLHTRFLILADGRLSCLFTPGQQHQGYPGRVHGGVLAAVLDELIGRVMQIEEPDTFSVTIDLAVKYRQPVPLGVEATGVAWATKNTARSFEGAAELYLADGSVAAQATAKYLKLPTEDIAQGGFEHSELLPDHRPLPAEVLA